MKLKLLTIAFTTIFSLSSLAQTPGQIADEVIEKQHGNYHPVILSERILLKKYLEEVEKRTELEIAQALAYLEFQREVFKEYNQRWWTQYNESQREKRIREYWVMYQQGRQHAQDLANNTSGNNYCKVITQFVQKPEDRDFADATAREAFLRGAVSSFPECFIANLLDQLKNLDGNVSNLEKTIFEIKKRLMLYKPDERALKDIYTNLEKGLKEVLTQEVEKAHIGLKKALLIDTDVVARIEQNVMAISSLINCPNLRGRNGERFSCQVRVLNPAHELSVNDTFRVIFEKQALGPFQQRLVLAPFLKSVAYYLTAVNPQDQIVNYLVSDLEETVTKMQTQNDRKVENLNKRYKVAVTDRLDDFRINQRNTWRSMFPLSTTEKIVDLFYDLKVKIEAYSRWESGTQLEEKLVNEIASNYSDALSSAGQTEVLYELPSRTITLELNDNEGSILNLDVEIPSIPGGYLFGPEQVDVSNWVQLLSI